VSLNKLKSEKVININLFKKTTEQTAIRLLSPRANLKSLFFLTSDMLKKFMKLSKKMKS